MHVALPVLPSQVAVGALSLGMVKLEQNGAAAGQPYKPTTMFDDDEPDAELDSILRMTSSTHPASLSFEMEVQQHKQPRGGLLWEKAGTMCMVREWGRLRPLTSFHDV